MTCTHCEQEITYSPVMARYFTLDELRRVHFFCPVAESGGLHRPVVEKELVSVLETPAEVEA